MRPLVVLLGALALATLGMAVIVFAVVSPGLFFPGVYLLDAAFVALTVAGVWYVIAPPSASEFSAPGLRPQAPVKS